MIILVICRITVFVIEFTGDMLASQVKVLREEVTAVLGSASVTRGDTVVVKLNSGGGSVSSYGLGASQLERIKVAPPFLPSLTRISTLSYCFFLLFRRRVSHWWFASTKLLQVEDT
jgi:hypothetical protein